MIVRNPRIYLSCLLLFRLFLKLLNFLKHHIYVNICFLHYFRTLSTLNSVPLAANTTAVSKSESREFMSVFPGQLYDLF